MTIREASAVGVEPVVLTSESTVVGLYEPEETDRAVPTAETATADLYTPRHASGLAG